MIIWRPAPLNSAKYLSLIHGLRREPSSLSGRLGVLCPSFFKMHQVANFSNFASENPQVKSSLVAKIKDGLHHYWHGSKLLAYETKISSRLLMKILKGKKLVRREHRQLLRTTSDLLRLVPFLIIVLIPFLEFALPIILKLFPNMLPSTFEDKATFVSLLWK